jgi:hypothetical protein
LYTIFKGVSSALCEVTQQSACGVDRFGRDTHR